MIGRVLVFNRRSANQNNPLQLHANGKVSVVKGIIPFGVLLVSGRRHFPSVLFHLKSQIRFCLCLHICSYDKKNRMDNVRLLQLYHLSTRWYYWFSTRLLSTFLPTSRIWWISQLFHGSQTLGSFISVSTAAAAFDQWGHCRGAVYRKICVIPALQYLISSLSWKFTYFHRWLCRTL